MLDPMAEPFSAEWCGAPAGDRDRRRSQYRPSHYGGFARDRLAALRSASVTSRLRPNGLGATATG